MASKPPISLLAMSDENFDINNVDEEMREIVTLLRDSGFKTFTSCAGGEGHMFKDPIVRIYPIEGQHPYEVMNKLEQWLLQMGYIGFHVSVTKQVSCQKKDGKFCAVHWPHFVEVYLNDLECLRRLKKV